MSDDITLTPDLLLRAYAYGVFPMGEDRDDPKVFWVDPPQRGIFPLDSFHVPRRLARLVAADRFSVSHDTGFRDVMRACAEPAPGRTRTWINDTIIDVYCELFARGFAHSIECRLDGELVGGLYGVSIGAAFFGESMFSRERDASKVALVHLVGRLRAGGFRLLDAQFTTAHLKQFGAIDIDRRHYQRLLDQALAVEADFYRLAGGATSEELLQSVSQTS